MSKMAYTTLLTTLLMLASCENSGRNNETSSGQEAEPTITGVVSSGGGRVASAGSPSSTEERSDGANGLLALKVANKEQELPSCTKAQQGQAVYVKANKTFKYCNELLEWEPIEMRGPTGPAGAVGAKGDKGDAGLAGAPGIAGSTGASHLISQIAEPAGVNCTHGGVKIGSGVDIDKDGVLDDSEITGSSYVCRQESGLRLVADNGTAVGFLVSILSLPGVYSGSELIFVIRSLNGGYLTAYSGFSGLSITKEYFATSGSYFPVSYVGFGNGSLQRVRLEYYFARGNYTSYSQLHFTTSDCTGQAYLLSGDMSGNNSFGLERDAVLGSLPNLVMTWKDSVLVVDRLSPSRRQFASVISDGGGCQSTIFDGLSVPVRKLSNSQSPFPATISAGWSLSP